MDPNSNTDQLDPSNAATKVFNTFELLENILIFISKANLPRKNDNYISRAQRLRLLYPLQRINKTFRNVINRSKTLREHMFKGMQEEEVVARPGTSKRWRLFRRILNPFAVVMYQLVPLGRISFHSSNLTPDSMFLEGRVVVPSGVNSLEETRRLPRSASWRQMLISCKPVGFFVRLDAEVHGQAAAFYDFKLEKGATLGQLVDIVVSIVGTEDRGERKRGGQMIAADSTERKRQRRESVRVYVTENDEQKLKEGQYSVFDH